MLLADSRICLAGLRAKDGSINRAKDVSPLRVGTKRSLLRSYKTRICSYHQSMFRQAQHDTRCCGLIRTFADSLIRLFAHSPMRLSAPWRLFADYCQKLSFFQSLGNPISFSCANGQDSISVFNLSLKVLLGLIMSKIYFIQHSAAYIL